MYASLIIPVLNDEVQLDALLRTLERDPRVEVIVVNGGAPGRLVALERSAPHVRWLTSAPGRGVQMNAGALAASGHWLVFLHADTRLPTGWMGELQAAAGRPAVLGGSFRFRLDSPSCWARLIEQGVALRVRWFGLPYGDQALFVRRDAFVALGGYRELPLMEDVDLVRRLRRRGRLHHSPLPAETSARRWETDGWIRRSVENVVLVVLFLSGVSPARLAAAYRRGTSTAAGQAQGTATRDG